MLIRGGKSAAATSNNKAASPIQCRARGLRALSTAPAMSTHHVQSSAPAGLIEEVEQDMREESDPVAYAGLLKLIGWSHEGPIDKHGTADDVLPGNKAPVAAVEADGAVVAHGKIFPRRDDQVASLQVSRQID